MQELVGEEGRTLEWRMTRGLRNECGVKWDAFLGNSIPPLLVLVV